MRIVVDTNRIIASCIKEGSSREILFNSNFQFFCPEEVLYEIEEHRDEIMKKSGLDRQSFQLILDFLFENIKVIDITEYSDFMEECSKLTKDQDDIVFFALAKAINADGIWTEDKGFRDQKQVRIYTNDDMFSFMN